MPWCQENRCSGSGNALVKVQDTNLLCHVEQMYGVCQLLCGLPLLFLVVQEVLSCSWSYQKCMHVQTRMGGDGRNGEDSEWFLNVGELYSTLLAVLSISMKWFLNVQIAHSAALTQSSDGGTSWYSMLCLENAAFRSCEQSLSKMWCWIWYPLESRVLYVFSHASQNVVLW